MLAEQLLLMLIQAAATTTPPNDEPPYVDDGPSPIAVEMTLEQYCKTRACRHDVDISVRDAAGKTTRVQRKLMPPAVEPDMLNILPGETVQAVAEFKGGKFSGWRVPSSMDGADAVYITIELKQNAGDAGMVATIRNSSSRNLKLRMGLVRLDAGARPESTSSCPLVPKSSGYENWPFPIATLLVRDVRILAPSDKVGCE
jgi:hypothetical protein